MKICTYPGRYVLALFFLCLIFTPSFAQTTAFPGAEGFGRLATGGRNGTVYIVSNLNDAGPGSFRDAVSQPNRIVVFAVGGVIKITARVVVAANITIAGQTAPGDGIVIYGNGLSFTQAHNCIVRYLRIRMGVGGTSGTDAVGATDNANNQIFDHVSVSWGRDENFSITGNADSITIQNSIIAQGLQTHSCGGLLEPSGKLSLYRNLYIDNNTRNPKVKGTNQFVNNIVYNWGYGGAYIMGDSEGESRVNIINNYYIKGPSSTVKTFSRGTATFIPYVEGNYQDTNRNGALDGVPVALPEYEGITTFSPTPYDYPMPASLLTAQQAYDHVLSNAGASFPYRDQVDQFLFSELTSLGTQGALIANENVLPTGGVGEVHGAPAPTDTDQDGMPDAWETSHGLNPNNAADGRALTPDGYTNLEVYINTLPTLPPAGFIRPPSQVVATADTTRITLQWKDNATQEDQLIIERSLNGITYTQLVALPANATSYTDTPVLSNTTYYYRLKAVNSAEASVYSIPVSVKTRSIPAAPAAPVNPAPAHLSPFIEPGSLALKWTGSANTTLYHVYLGNSAATLEKKADTTAATYTINGLQENTTYYWRVDATNDLGTTTGDIWSFTTLRNYPPGMMGNWQLDATTGTTATDSSAFENHGELQDITDILWVPGKNNQALDLKHATTTTHILIPHQDQLYFNKNGFTISLWVKAPAQTAQSYLLHKGSFARNATTGATGKWYGIEVKDGKIRFAIDDDITKSEVAANNPPFFTNQWVHVVVQRDVVAKKLRLFRNGFLEAEANDNTNTGIGQTDPLVIANSSDLNVPFKGMLDEIRIYNYSLSEMQVLELFHTDSLPLQPFAPSMADKAGVEGYQDITLSWKGGIKTTHYKLYTGASENNLQYVQDIPVNTPAYLLNNPVAGATYYWRVDAVGPAGITTGNTWSFKTISPKGLVAHWRLDETSGATAYDSSQYHHPGTLAGLTQPTWQPTGRFKGNLLFNTPVAAGAVTVPHADHLLFDQNSFTISLWVKIASNTYNFSTGGDAYLIHKGTFEANTGKWYGIQLRDGKLTFAIDDGLTKTDLVTTVNAAPYNIFTNQWKHILVIRDVPAKQMKMYIDGVLTGTKAYTTGTTGRLTNLLIGNSPENKPYRDLMDDVRLYNYALTPSEITALRDTVSPTVITKNISVPLQNGQAIISPADINNGSYDSTGIASFQLDSSSFDCSAIGEHTLTLTATDFNGNSASATATVTITGSIPVPVITTAKKGYLQVGDANTLYLGIGSQQMQLMAADTSAAAGLQYHWSPAAGLNNSTISNPVFTAATPGSFSYTVSVTNGSGCTADTQATVKVVDARCGNDNNKIVVCYNNREFCLPPLAALLLILLNNNAVVPGACSAPLLTANGRGVVSADQLEDAAAITTGIAAWPNPAGNHITIRFSLPDSRTFSVDMYNASGQLVQLIDKGIGTKGRQYSYQLNTASLRNGIYIIKVATDKSILTKRIIVQH